jgi:nucleoid DNA-binding protein
LRPTKGKDLIKKTAEHLGLSEELVKDVVDFYYERVAKKIESLEHPTIYLHGLGTLRLSRKKLQRDIDGLKKILDGETQEDFKKVIKYNLSKALLDSKIKGLEICNEYYKEIYEKRYKDLEK